MTELAKAAGLPKTTAQRLLEQLAAEVAAARHGRLWVPGRAPYEFGSTGAASPGLIAVVGPRLHAFAKGTGGSAFFSVAKRSGPLTLDRIYGPLTSSLMPIPEQASAAEHPASAVRQAIEEGRTVVERGRVHSDFACVATVFELPTGEAAVLSLAVPEDQAIERLRRPLDRSASAIAREAVRLFRKRTDWGPATSVR